MRLFRRTNTPPFRLFFATDVHGSDRCFRKFLAAAPAFNANALVLGGDIAGKAIVPIVAEGQDRFSYAFQGVRETVGGDDLGTVRQRLNFNGLYPRVIEPSEAEQMATDPEYVAGVFEQIIAEQTAEWCDLAAERLADDVRCIITPGNDDPFAIDNVLGEATKVECPERQVVQLGPAWLASLGNTNRTPWNTDREYDESDLGRQITAMLDLYSDGRPLVLNFHVPPHDTGLDKALKLDADLRPVVDHGSPVEIPVGSTAVREAIEQYQPVAGLHGHIHESQHVARLGRTWCFNPGSDYSSGVLKGLILDLEETGDYRQHLFTSG